MFLFFFRMSLQENTDKFLPKSQDWALELHQNYHRWNLFSTCSYNRTPWGESPSITSRESITRREWQRETDQIIPAKLCCDVQKKFTWGVIKAFVLLVLCSRNIPHPLMMLSEVNGSSFDDLVTLWMSSTCKNRSWSHCHRELNVQSIPSAIINLLFWQLFSKSFPEMD